MYNYNESDFSIRKAPNFHVSCQLNCVASFTHCRPSASDHTGRHSCCTHTVCKMQCTSVALWLVYLFRPHRCLSVQIATSSSQMSTHWCKHAMFLSSNTFRFTFALIQPSPFGISILLPQKLCFLLHWTMWLSTLMDGWVWMESKLDPT